MGLSAAHVVTDIYSPPVLSAILPLLILEYGYSYFLAAHCHRMEPDLVIYPAALWLAE